MNNTINQVEVVDSIDVIYAPDIVGASIERYEYVEETGLYHWHGESNYAGYTAEELEDRMS